MTSGGKWIGVIVVAALLALTACSSGDDKSSTDAAPTTLTGSISPQPPAPPAREDGKMPEEAFDRFTAIHEDVTAAIPEWTADARECTTLGRSGDLQGFRDCVTQVWTEADKSLSKAGSNTAAESGEIATECLEAATTYATAVTNLRAAAALARGYADSLDVKSMPGALKALVKGRKAYANAGAQVRIACKPS